MRFTPLMPKVPKIPKKHSFGFTLLEAMIAMVFFATAFVFLMNSYNMGVFADVYLDRGIIAVNLAQERMEELKRGTYASIAVGTTTENPVSGFSTPRFRRITQVTEFPGARSNYKRITVTVSWLMKGDIATPTAWQDYALATYISDY